MVNVSKNPLDPRIERRIRANLMTALFSSPNTKQSKMLGALLTQSERIMLAKRLAVIIMLDKDSSYYHISKTLKVSISTVMHTEHLLQKGVYAPIVGKVRSASSRTLLESLELLLSAGMPSIAGPKHQKRLNALKNKGRA